jgi:WD40 repeat protein
MKATRKISLPRLLFALLLVFALPAHAESDTSSLQLRELRTLNNDFPVTVLAWHPDNRHLAVGQVLNKRVAIWDTQSGKLVRTLENEPGGVSSLRYSPDAKYLAVGREFTRRTQGAHVHLYDAQSGALLHGFTPPSAPAKGDSNDANALAFSPDGKYLVANGYGSGRTAVVYDVTSKSAIQTLSDSSEPGFRVINSLTFSPDNRFVALGRVGGRIDVWFVSGWKLNKRFLGQSAGVHALTFSPDGQFLASGTNIGERWDRSVKPAKQQFAKFNDDVVIWSVPAFEKVAQFPSRHFKHTPNSSVIERMQFSPDGRHLLVSARSDSVEIIDVATGKSALFKDGFRVVAHTASSPSGNRLAIGLQKKIELHELTDR